MPSINTIVWKIIADDLCIQKDLKRDLINIRGLARYIIKKKNLNVSIDAVISAIRRYETEAIFSKQTKNIEKILKSIIINTKSNICCLTLKDSEFKIISQDFISKNILKENFRLIKSKELVKIFLNQKELDKKLNLFIKSNIISVTKDLAEIRITMPKEASGTAGILARISQEIALQEVSIDEIIAAVPEILIYVKNKDLVNAHKAVMEIV